MIVGNGLIANSFRENDLSDVVFFASGVSNSLETDENQFLREENLIRKTITENPKKLFVYFSTCSIYDSSKTASPYVKHKLNMEHLVSVKCEKYLIARASNAVGNGGNSHTLINFLVRSIRENKLIKVHIDATRNLIDVEDIREIILDLINKNHLNHIVNVAYPQNYPIIQIIATIEEFLGKTASLELVKAGQSYSVDIPEVENYFRKNNMIDKEIYLKNMLQKYYRD